MIRRPRFSGKRRDRRIREIVSLLGEFQQDCHVRLFVPQSAFTGKCWAQNVSFEILQPGSEAFIWIAMCHKKSDQSPPLVTKIQTSSNRRVHALPCTS